MNRKKLIADWLEGGGYREGLMLLKKLDPGNQFMRVLEKGANPYNKGKLRLQLLDLMGTSRQPLKTESDDMVPYVMPRTVAPTGSPPPREKLYPPKIAQAIQSRAKAVNARNKVSNSLGDIATTSQRAEAVEQISVLQEEIKALGDYIGHWERTGQIQEFKRKTTPKEKEELEKEYKNLMTKRSLAARNIRRWETRQKGVRNDKIRQGNIDHYKQVHADLDAEVKRVRQILKSGTVNE